MLKKTKTQTSSVGRSQIKSSHPEKQDVFDIFSDSNPVENSKSFNSPQEETEYSNPAVVPDLPLPSSKKYTPTNISYNNANFNLHNNVLIQNSKREIDSPITKLDKKAYEPLDTVGSYKIISNLSSTQMSKNVLEKYPEGNNIAHSNASYPADFQSEIQPIQNNFTIKSFDQTQYIKSEVHQKTSELQFETISTLKDKNEVKQILNNKLENNAKETISSNFLTSSDLSATNVFSNYNSTTKEYGTGQFPQNSQASSIMNKNSIDAKYAASPQRGIEAMSKPESKNSFKGSEIKTTKPNIDTSIKNKIINQVGLSNYSSNSNSICSNSLASKDFFVSNFNSTTPTISSNISSSSSTIDNASNI